MGSAESRMVSVAVVIPARNAGLLLVDCVAHVHRQSRNADEILIVIGPSTDTTRRVAEGLRGGVVRILENPAGDRASALNAALRATHSEILAMVDAQSLIAPDYLEQALAVLDRSSCDIAGGPMRPRGVSAVGRAFALALTSRFGIGDSQFHQASRAGPADSVYLGIYRKSVFERIGAYNPALLRTEDDDLNARAREAGFRIWLDPAIRSVYLCRNDLRSIWRQYLGYGYWKVALATVCPGALRPRHAVPAVFVLTIAAGAAVSVVAWPPTLPLLMAIYLSTAWSVAFRLPGQTQARLLFPVATAVMHLAYGCGTIAGVFSLPRLARRAREGALAAKAGRPR